MNGPARYTGTAIALHWLVAALLLGGFALGATMTGLPNGVLKLKLYNWHKWLGASVLALTLLRLAWRLRHAPPPLPPAMPVWQRHAAAAVQAALLVLCLLVPLLGWAYSSAAGFPLVWLGLVPLPDWVPQDRALAQAIKPWHGRAAWLLALLAGGHAAAALKHQWLDRDGLLRRMAPWGR
ncbi:MAG: cytochrome b/b6 domain-containing protein [Rubrivivax sp.]